MFNNETGSYVSLHVNLIYRHVVTVLDSPDMIEEVDSEGE